MSAPAPRAAPSAPQSPVSMARSVTICGAIAVGIGLVGFLVGIAEPVVPTRATDRVPAIPTESTRLAPSYREINSAVVGPNQSWTSSFALLKQTRPDLFAPVVRTPAMKDAALRDRLRTRAFDGAPPVIPHRVEQQSAQSCLVCHRDGMQLGHQIATKISHPHIANCLGCHVEQAGSLPIAIYAETPANLFAGLLRAGPGFRAMPGAPPSIPHTTHLRGDCLSCHGLIARPGLRTTHPWLQNCVQCHASPAETERIPFQASSSAAISGQAAPLAAAGLTTEKEPSP
jgi:nitrate reductase (cytochrome), electron transfer subunit